MLESVTCRTYTLYITIRSVGGEGHTRSRQVPDHLVRILSLARTRSYTVYDTISFQFSKEKQAEGTSKRRVVASRTAAALGCPHYRTSFDCKSQDSISSIKYSRGRPAPSRSRCGKTNLCLLLASPRRCTPMLCLLLASPRRCTLNLRLLLASPRRCTLNLRLLLASPRRCTLNLRLLLSSPRRCTLNLRLLLASPCTCTTTSSRTEVN
ncbi:hypothetical protein J6590_084777 [Homalodisca vitripennis]|nr:hypothetical protein J6590_084777 [Homalodisca vitripennis]